MSQIAPALDDPIRKDRVAHLVHVVGALVTFSRQVHLKRSLANVDNDPQTNFWRIIYGGLTNLAVIEWCKLFGAQGNNSLHWKRTFPDRQGEFRIGLCEAISTDFEKFTAYRDEIKRWRDADFAHSDPNSPRPSKWPDFTIALSAADYYYKSIFEELCTHRCYLDFKSLGRYGELFEAECAQVALKAVQATQSLPRSRY